MPQKESVGFAILGAGMVADYHHQAITANADLGAKLVAIGHYNPARFAEISAKFGVPCLSEAEMLAHPEVEVVCICTPGGQHAAQTIAAARAGKHVLVEKPMALNLIDADAMIDACAQAGVKLGVTLQRRAEPLFKQIYAAVQGGDLGELTLGLVSMPYVRSEAYYQQAEYRGTWTGDGGGVLMTQGIHIVDLLIWYMGDPVAVRAYAGTLHRNVAVEDTLTAILRFANGSQAAITATTTAAPGFNHRLEIYGTNGGIQVDGEHVARWEIADSSQATVAPPALGAAKDAGAGGDPRGISPSGHIAIFRDFIEALTNNRPPQVDGAEGRRSLATILAIYEDAGLL